MKCHPGIMTPPEPTKNWPIEFISSEEKPKRSLYGWDRRSLR